MACRHTFRTGVPYLVKQVETFLPNPGFSVGSVTDLGLAAHKALRVRDSKSTAVFILIQLMRLFWKSFSGCS